MAWLSILTACFVFYLGLTNAQPPIPSEAFDYQKELDSTYEIFWKFNEEGLTLEIHCRTTGWCGFGTSITGYMAGSDMFTAGVANGRPYIHDRFASSRKKPAVDEDQNVQLLTADERGGWTVVKIRRHLFTVDTNDNVIYSGLVNVVWAWGRDDPTDSARENITKHARSGKEAIELLPPPPLANGVWLKPGIYYLSWEYDDVSITIEARVRNRGWIGLGISPTGDMTDSDILIAYIKNDRVTYEDRYARGYHQEPIVDDRANWNLQYAKFDGTWIVIRVQRDQAAFDDNDRAISRGRVHVVYAYNDKTPGVSTDNNLPPHGTRERGSMEVELIPKTPSAGGAPAPTRAPPARGKGSGTGSRSDSGVADRELVRQIGVLRNHIDYAGARLGCLEDASTSCRLTPSPSR